MNLLRFVAAVLVIFTHSYALAIGNPEKDWLNILTHGQINMGSLAVNFFFFCSGFLVVKTLEQDYTFVRFFCKKVKRLCFPLAIVIIASIAIGGMITTLTISDYIMSKQTWKYLLNICLIPVHNLPGVFEYNIGTSCVNMALWTLPLEMCCFICAYFAKSLKLFTKKGYIVIFFVSILLEMILDVATPYIHLFSVHSIIQPTMLFVIGMGYWIYKDFIRLDRRFFFFFSLLFFISYYFNLGYWLFFIAFPYVTIYVCYSSKKNTLKNSALGRYSYGMYLWGCPVQQMEVYLFGGQMPVILNLFIAIPVCMLLSMFTDYLLKKR